MHHPVRIIFVLDQVQDRDQQQRHRLGQVKGASRGVQDVIGVPEVTGHKRSDATAVRQPHLVGVGQDDGVVVHAHQPHTGGSLMHDIGHTARARDPGPYVEELTDAARSRQPLHHPSQEGSIRAHIRPRVL